MTDLRAQFRLLVNAFSTVLMGLLSVLSDPCQKRFSANREAMNATVLLRRNDLQVFDAVVGFIAVAMMDVFLTCERATKMLFDHKPVLIHVPSFMPHNHVSSGCNRAALPTGIFGTNGILISATVGTVFPAVGLTRLSDELGTAENACEGDRLRSHGSGNLSCRAGAVDAVPGFLMSKSGTGTIAAGALKGSATGQPLDQRSYPVAANFIRLEAIRV